MPARARLGTTWWSCLCDHSDLPRSLGELTTGWPWLRWGDLPAGLYMAAAIVMSLPVISVWSALQGLTKIISMLPYRYPITRYMIQGWISVNNSFLSGLSWGYICNRSSSSSSSSLSLLSVSSSFPLPLMNWIELKMVLYSRRVVYIARTYIPTTFVIK